MKKNEKYKVHVGTTSWMTTSMSEMTTTTLGQSRRDDNPDVAIESTTMSTT